VDGKREIVVRGVGLYCFMPDGQPQSGLRRSKSVVLFFVTLQKSMDKTFHPVERKIVHISFYPSTASVTGFSTREHPGYQTCQGASSLVFWEKSKSIPNTSFF